MLLVTSRVPGTPEKEREDQEDGDDEIPLNREDRSIVAMENFAVPQIPRIYLVLIGLLLVLNMVDVGTTLYALGAGGMEGNPIIAMVVGNPQLFAALKVAGVAGIALWALFCERVLMGSGKWCLGAAVGFYFLPVVNNIYQILGAL